MAFFMDPGAMFLGCLNGVEQKFLIELIKTARRSGYTRFVEPCAGTFAMANLAIQSGFKPEQIETSDVNMMTSVMGYAITGQSLEPLQIHAQGFSDEELLDPAVALYAQIYLRTSKSAGNEYFHNILRDLNDRREEHIESIRRQLEATKSLLGGMSYRPLDMWDHLREVKDDPHTIIVANPPTYFAGYEKFSDIRNVGAAIHSMIESVTEKMDEVGFKDDEEWTYLTKIFGSNAIPAESAATITKAIKKAEKDGAITSKNRWQLIEMLATEYLAGK